jgi:CHAT domain-containing protein
MTLRFLAAAAAIPLLVSGCQPEKPTVSLEQAKQITAKFETSSFTPPPRTIDDIAALLDRDKPDPARTAALRSAVKAEIPAGDAVTRSEAYFARSKAAYDLGLIPQAKADAEAALRIARAGRLDLHDILMHLRIIATLTGSLRDLVAISEEIINNVDGTQRGRLFVPLAMLAFNLANTGDEVGARRYLGTANALLAEARNWQGGRPFGVFGDIWEGQVLLGRAALDQSLGSYDEAEAGIREAIARIEAFLRTPAGQEVIRRRSTPNIPNIHRGGAFVNLLVRRGRLAEAEAMSRQAVSTGLREDGRYHATTAFLMTSLARVIVEQGRFAEGERLARITLETYRAIGASADSWRAAEAHALLADALAGQDRWKETLAAFDELERGFAGYPDGLERFVNNRPTRALALLMTGRAEDAAAALRPLVDRHDANLGRTHYVTAETKGLYGLALAAAGRRAEAMTQFRAAVPVLMQRSRQVSLGTEGDSTAVRSQRQLMILDGYISVLAASNDTASIEEAFRIADIARAQGVQGALAASGARAAARDPGLADLARREQDAQSQIGALYGTLTTQFDLPAAERNAAVINRLRARIDDLRAARAAIASEIEKRFPAYAELISPRPATVAQARQLLKPDEALVVTWLGERGSYVWAVPKTGPLAFAPIGMDRDAVGRTVTGLRRALDPQVSTLGEIPAFDTAAAHALYRALLGPVEAGWKGARSLLVVAHGPLGALPLQVLTTAPAKPGPEAEPLFANYRTVPFLARSHAVTVLPSVSALATLRDLPAAPATRRSFAGFGDPLFSPAQVASASAPSSAGGTAVASRGVFAARSLPVKLRAAPKLDGVSSADLARLPRLPDTADEVRSIAAAINADPARDVFTGRDATESRVKAMALADYRIVAFATHGLVPGDLDGLTQPALALTSPAVSGSAGGDDGLLTMGEILGLRMDADWVVLSACNTASGDGAGAESVSGLGRAFFYAGTRALLVSNWPVETSSARALTTDVFARQAKDASLARAEALRRAMEGLIDGPGFRDGAGRTVFSYAHPIFWAPFSLVGDGAGGR